LLSIYYSINFQHQIELTYSERVRAYLNNCTVGIAGCGGLGSTCAVSLARAGVGKLIIADFDIVTKENLERQYYFLEQVGMLKVNALKDNIQRIDPSIMVKDINKQLFSSDIFELYSGCDVIVEAFDNAEMKLMIIETVMLQLPDIPLVSGIGLAGWGKTDLLRVHRSENLIVCGDEISEISETTPLIAPRVGIVSNMEANEVLELLMVNFEQ